MSRIKITGLKELKKDLKKLSERTARNITVSALRAGATDISKQAKANVPQDEGDLRKAIGVIKRKSKKTIILFTVLPRSKTLHKLQDVEGKKRHNYGGYVEFGNSRQAAQPYMRPTFDQLGRSVTDAIVKQMTKRIEKEANKGML